MDDLMKSRETERLVVVLVDVLVLGTGYKGSEMFNSAIL